MFFWCWVNVGSGDQEFSSLICTLFFISSIAGLVIIRKKWIAEARRKEIMRLVAMAAEEAERAELEAAVEYGIIFAKVKYATQVPLEHTTTKIAATFEGKGAALSDEIAGIQEGVMGAGIVKDVADLDEEGAVSLASIECSALFWVPEFPLDVSRDSSVLGSPNRLAPCAGCLKVAGGPSSFSTAVGLDDLVEVEGFVVPGRDAMLYYRIWYSRGHLAPDGILKGMPMVLVLLVSETLQVISDIATCADNEMNLERLSGWKVCLDTARSIGLQVSWVQDRLNELTVTLKRRMEGAALVEVSRTALSKINENLTALADRRSRAVTAVKEAHTALGAVDAEIEHVVSSQAVHVKVISNAEKDRPSSRSILYGLL